MFDVIDGGGENAFVNGSDSPFELLGIETGICPDDGDYRDIDVGEDVSGGTKDDNRADQQDQQCQNDKGVRAREGDSDDPHLKVLIIYDTTKFRKSATKDGSAHLK